MNYHNLKVIFTTLVFLMVISGVYALSDYTNLPFGFSPNVGYYHQLNNKIVSLWSNDKVFQANNFF